MKWIIYAVAFVDALVRSAMCKKVITFLLFVLFSEAFENGSRNILDQLSVQLHYLCP